MHVAARLFEGGEGVGNGLFSGPRGRLDMTYGRPVDTDLLQIIDFL